MGWGRGRWGPRAASKTTPSLSGLLHQLGLLPLLCYSPVITLNATSVVMTTYYPSLGKSPICRGVRLSPAPWAPSSSLQPPSTHLRVPQLSPSLPPSHFVLSERSLLFSKFPEFSCYFCFWSHFVTVGLISPSFSPSLSFSRILRLFLGFRLSPSLCLSVCLSPSFSSPPLSAAGIA